jgi:hypothetical protein
MINLVSTIKSKLLAFNFKSFYKAVLSLVAIALLVTTTACNSSKAVAKTNLDNPPPGKITELYKPITPEVGGNKTHNLLLNRI